MQKEYIWLGDTPLAVFEGANLFYVHPDHLDRPVMMTNSAAQTIAWQAKYDPFGNPVTVTVSPVNNQRLPGQWFQIEDGLSYNWHRTYDPSLGRYNQADPLGFVDGPGIYNYAVGSPAIIIDRDGRIGIGGFIIGAGVNGIGQITTNYLTNGGNLWLAIKCVDVLDVLLSGGLGSLGVGGNLWNGNYKAAGLGVGLGFYMKKLMTPYLVNLVINANVRKNLFWTQ